MPADESELREFLTELASSHPTPEEVLAQVRAKHPGSTDIEIRVVLEAIAHGQPCAASQLAASGLCALHGIGDPLATAETLYSSEETEDLSEPQWFAWIAGYSYNWICNGGLASCYFDFDDRQFADRIRVYDAIGAATATQVLRAADAVFGEQGPPQDADQRRALATEAVHEKLAALSPQFWGCGDEIFTRVLLYAVAHADHFRCHGNSG